jgi:hypothetical protein
MEGAEIFNNVAAIANDNAAIINENWIDDVGKGKLKVCHVDACLQHSLLYYVYTFSFSAFVVAVNTDLLFT